MIVKKIVIAGAGIIGNSIAYYLAKNYDLDSLSVTLIDPVGICPAASAKAGGFLAQDWRDGTPIQELHRLSFGLHENLSRELDSKTIDYRRLSSRTAAVDGALSGRKHNSRKVLPSSTMEWVDDDVVLASVQTGTEKDIAQVHPKKLCERMWEYSASKGVKLKIGRVVEAVLKEEGREEEDDEEIKAVRLEDGSIIEADDLVVSIGPWTEEMRLWFPKTRKMKAALAAVPPVIGVKSHSMLVKTEKVLSEAVFFESNDAISDIEVYPRPDGDSYITGSSHPTQNMTERPGEEAVEEARKEELLDAMRRTSSKVLGGKEPHTVQACYWPETEDGMPIIGPLPNIRGVIIATGHSVWGILQGPATGLAVAEFLMNGKSTSVNLEPFALERKQSSWMDLIYGASAGGDDNELHNRVMSIDGTEL